MTRIAPKSETPKWITAIKLIGITLSCIISFSVLAQAAPAQKVGIMILKKASVPLPARNPVRKHRPLTTPVKKVALTQGKLKGNIPARTRPPQKTQKARLDKNALPRKAVLPTALKILQPALDIAPDETSHAQLQNIITSVGRKKFSQANTLLNQMQDGIHKDIAQWFYLRKVPAKMPEARSHLESFLSRRSDWPSSGYLKSKLEQATLNAKLPPHDLVKFFTKRPPRSTTARLELAKAWSDLGQSGKANAIARKLWHTGIFGKKQIKKFQERFGSVLRPKDHQIRSDYFLFKNSRKNIRYADQAYKFLPKSSQQVASVQSAFIRRSRKAQSLYDALSIKQRQNYALQFNRAVWLRRSKKKAKSLEVLTTYSAKGHVAAHLLSKTDWKERRVQVRTALNDGNHAGAAKIIAVFHRTPGHAKPESLFLEGWIQLRFLNNPKRALRHFTKLARIARPRRTKAKTEYWLARTHDALGDYKKATLHLEKAAGFSHTYYGVLAAQTLGKPVGEILTRLSHHQYSKQQEKAFLKNSIVQAAIISGKHRQYDFQRRFLNHLSWKLKSESEMQLLLELGNQIAPTYSLIKLGKVALYRGFDLAPYGFPLDVLPTHRQLTEDVPDDFVHALIRQESEFNPKVKSPAGARGLMQLMPGTARMVARKHKVKYSRSRLTSDPAYNLQLGKALLRGLLDNYTDSYLLTLVAYNAGPGRARSWSKEFGDPRDPNIDVIDWVERIPFTETRRYVKRIMTNLMTYRSRMGITQKLTLVRALKGNPPPKPEDPIGELLSNSQGTPPKPELAAN